MTFREARIEDIAALHRIRLEVKENPLNNPALVTESDYIEYLTVRGKGWLCEHENITTGFAIIDRMENNIWALFIKPGYEKKGIGKKLHDMMLDWHFANSRSTLWLGTAPGTRAEHFYTAAGWKSQGLQPNGEIRFEMSFQDWSS